MTYDDAIRVYDNMDNLQRAGVSIRLYDTANRVHGNTAAKEVLRRAIEEEMQQLPLP